MMIGFVQISPYVCGWYLNKVFICYSLKHRLKKITLPNVFDMLGKFLYTKKSELLSSLFHLCYFCKDSSVVIYTALIILLQGCTWGIFIRGRHRKTFPHSHICCIVCHNVGYLQPHNHCQQQMCCPLQYQNFFHHLLQGQERRSFLKLLIYFVHHCFARLF